MAVDLNRMCELALYRVQYAVASMAFAATHALVADERLRSAAQIEMEEAESLLENAELDAHMEAEARAHQAEFQADEEARIEAEAERRLFRETHTWQQAVLLEYPHAGSPVERAAAAIHDYLVAGDDATFAYDCARNPDGIEQSVFNERHRDSRELMLASLSLLKASEAKAVLRFNRGRDLDGSSYAATDMNEVRAWREASAHLTIADVDANRRGSRGASLLH